MTIDRRSDELVTPLGVTLTSRQLDAIKRVLILLVVIGHSKWQHPFYQLIKGMIYNFHAVLFLVLPFLFAAGPIDLNKIRNRLIRYYVPMLWFVGLAFLLKNFVLDAEPGISGDDLADLIRSLVIGTGASFNTSAELALFWFLPALFGIFLWRGVCETFPKWVSYLVYANALVVFFSLGSHTILQSSPTIATISLYAMILGPCVLTIARYTSRITGGFWIGALGLIACLTLLQVTGRAYNIAKLNLPSAGDPIVILGYVATISFALVSLVGLCKLPQVQRVFAPVGTHSLLIYLSHMFFIVGAEMALRRALTGLPDLAFPLSILVAITLAYATSALIVRFSLTRRLVLPR